MKVREIIYMISLFIFNKIATHVYATQDLFSKNIVSGGSGIVHNSSLTMMLSTAKLDDKAFNSYFKMTSSL